MRFAAGLAAWACTRGAAIALAAAAIPAARNWRRPTQQPHENSAIVISSRSVFFCLQCAGFVVAEPTGRFFAKIGPNLRDVTAECLAGNDFRGAWPRQVDFDH